MLTDAIKKQLRAIKNKLERPISNLSRTKGRGEKNPVLGRPSLTTLVWLYMATEQRYFKAYHGINNLPEDKREENKANSSERDGTN